MENSQLSTLFEKGLHEECLSALRNTPFDPKNLWLEGACLTRLHKYEEGLKKFQESWNTQNDSQSGVSYVRSLASLGRISEAEDLNSKLVQQWPGLDLEVCRAAFSCYKNGKLDEVLPLLNRGWQHNSSSPYLFMVIDFFQRLLAGKPHSDIPMQYRNHEQLAPLVEALDFALTAQRSGARLLAYPVEPLLLGLAQRPSKGWIAEFGVFWGRSINLIAQHSSQEIYGFDSFEGLPEDWKEGEEKGAYSTKGKLPEVEKNVQLIKGWFSNTLPEFLANQKQPASFIHIDCDLYSSTMDILICIKDYLQVGTVIVFDDYLGFPGYQHHEKKAFEEFIIENNMAFEVIGVTVLSREVAVRISKVG